MSRVEIQRALARLDGITRRLRRDCPWDREQDERSIVPHTVEEAYELADAADAGDDAKLVDELGDVLFQVHFLALLLEERGSGDLAAVAERCAEKLIRRHPHVFGNAEARSAAEVLRNWDAIKRDEPGRPSGTFADVPENLPALLLARKLQRRAASAGFDFPAPEASLQRLREAAGELEAAAGREERFAQAGDLLFAAVAVARRLGVDPELALRASARRFQGQAEAAEALAAAQDESWADLPPERQLHYYRRARTPR
ncbi:MAG: nucleoside triphosphate pyrophosphohydrolase [Solirubrobacteraceae bacterium]